MGQPITIPGDDISAVLNKLWDLSLFSSLDFYITNVEGEKIFLELAIKERPVLSKITVYGVKKRKIGDILDDTDLKKGKKITESLIANSKNYIENKYKKQGYLNTKVHIATATDTSDGKWNTIYKWDFSNLIKNPDLIIQRVENDILSSYQNILTVAKNV